MINWIILLLMKLTSSGVMASQGSREIQISWNHSRLNLHWNRVTTKIKIKKKKVLCNTVSNAVSMSKEDCNLTKANCYRANMVQHVNVMGYSHIQHTSFFHFHLPHSCFDEVPAHMAGGRGAWDGIRRAKVVIPLRIGNNNLFFFSACLMRNARGQ